MKYIHYGANHFDISLFNYNFNNRLDCKPYGGLWASPVNPDKYCWKDWCSDNDFHLDKLNKHFEFELSENSRVIFLKTKQDYAKFIERFGINNQWIIDFTIDFNAVAKEYDAIEIEINQLYFELYGWDCDSILILNPSVIVLD